MAETTKKVPQNTRRRAASYPALLITQNRQRFYFSTIPVDDLFAYCFVARRNEDPLTGFQRALNEGRADDIAAYLAAGNGSIPSNIVLSAQDVAEFSYDPRTKSVSFSRVPTGFLVLDGQHRLWGYQKCLVRHRVPVAIYEGLSRTTEAKLFIDINTTQRGVPAALLLDIKHLAEMESTREQTLRELFDRLNTDPKSPMVGKLSAAKSIAGKISRVTFNRAIEPVITGSVLAETDPHSRYRLIVNYLNALEAETTDKSILLKSAFFEAAFSVFDDVVRTTVAAHGSARPDALRQTLQPFARLSYYGTGGRTLQNKKEISALMRTALRKSVAISDDML